MTALLAKLRREPVAFYGGVISAFLVVLAVLGVSADTLATVATVATMLGIPVTRARVTPVPAKPAGDAGAVDPGSLALGLVAGLIVAWLLLH